MRFDICNNKSWTEQKWNVLWIFMTLMSFVGICAFVNFSLCILPFILSNISVFIFCNWHFMHHIILTPSPSSLSSSSLLMPTNGFYLQKKKLYSNKLSLILYRMYVILIFFIMIVLSKPLCNEFDVLVMQLVHAFIDVLKHIHTQRKNVNKLFV